MTIFNGSKTVLIKTHTGRTEIIWLPVSKIIRHEFETVLDALTKL